MSYIKIDDKRGFAELDGCWIDAKEAKERSRQHEHHQGDEWWTLLDLSGQKVDVKQYVKGAPRDKPFWLFENKDMYLGEWSKDKKEEGIGITYNNKPKGLICIAQWKGGLLNGKGKSSWLQESKIWLENRQPNSPIFEKDGRRTVKYPFTYDGEYVNSAKVAKNATVTLKNGMAKIGPWKEGIPVGDWWVDHTTLITNAGDERTSTRKRTTQGNNAHTRTKKSRKKTVPIKKEENDEINVSSLKDDDPATSSPPKQVKKKASSSTSRNHNASRQSNSSRSSAEITAVQTSAARTVPTTSPTTNQGGLIGAIETIERAVGLEPVRDVGALLRLSRLEQNIFGDMTLEVLVGIKPRLERLQRAFYGE